MKCRPFFDMAGYRGHTLGGVIAFAAFSTLVFVWPVFKLDTGELVLCLVAAILAALWPDVDTSSRGQDIFYALFLIADIVLIALKLYEYAALLGLFAMLPIVGKHRGWTHTFVATLVMPGVVLVGPMILARGVVWTGLPYFIAALLGYVSHLVLDREFKLI